MVVLTSRVFWPIGPSWHLEKMEDESWPKLCVSQNVNLFDPGSNNKHFVMVIESKSGGLVMDQSKWSERVHTEIYHVQNKVSRANTSL